MSSEKDDIIDVTEDEVDVGLPSIRDNLEEVLPMSFVRRMNEIPPEYRDKTPAELIALFKKNDLELSETIETLRDAFWLEYDRSVKANRKMLLQNIYHDICPNSTFTNICRNPIKFSYIVCPIIKYDARLNTILRANAVEVIREIMDAPMTDSNGFNIKLARLKLAAIKQLEDRTLGTPIQKSEIKQMNLNVNTGPTNRSVEDIKNKIAEIDKELQRKQIQENRGEMIKFLQNEYKKEED